VEKEDIEDPDNEGHAIPKDQHDEDNQENAKRD
jgi:hypothetical protein